MTITPIIREHVRQRANYLCEYCHSPERVSSSRFTLDHITPRSLGGPDTLNNLALACRRCNERRSNALASIDPETKKMVQLFNPRQQPWSKHFVWTSNGSKILGTTATGRATCSRLDLNDKRYPTYDSIQSARQFWVKAGAHPPKDDPCQG